MFSKIVIMTIYMETGTKVPDPLDQGSAHILYKGQYSKYKGPYNSVTTTQFYNCSMKVVVDNIWTNKHAWVPVKLYLQK